MRHKFRLLLIFSLITFIFLPIYSEEIKIASWNILNFPGSTGPSREDDFRKVIEQLDLDILVVQEMLSPAGVDQFFNNVMNYSSPGTYEAAPFRDGPDTDNALFYKKSTVNLISHDWIATTLRDISEYVLEIKEGPNKRTIFRIYSVHLKAGSSSDDKNRREGEVLILRNYLNDLQPDSLFLICGDFNMRSSEERAFEISTESQVDNDGRVKDPINRLGYWHDNGDFAEIHTQSTRKIQFGGGASGGLDDRFDLILISYEFDKSEELIYKEGSNFAYGNDGQHLNKAINDGVNGAVSAEIADALHEASDHLPVIIELIPPIESTPTLSITAGKGGTTNPSSGTYTYNYNTEVTITAIPNNGYRFKEWSGDSTGTNNPIKIVMDTDKSIKANFIQQYKLALSSGEGGTTDPSPGTYTYDAGEEVTITAIPESGYRFSEWSGDASGTSNPITITMDSNKSIKANFIRQYTLTIASGSGGTTDPAPGAYTYDEGTKVTITAIPNDYYIFNGWSGDISGKTNPITITMDSDKSITANFRLIYPPSNFTGQKVLNRSLSQAEYINVMKWEANPNNIDINIVIYRIYQIEDDSQSLLIELGADQFEYWHRRVEKDKQYMYALVAVNDKNREGDPAYITVQ